MAKGIEGKPGRQGRTGLSYNAPCRDGLPGGPGTRGLDGRPGVNLFLYLERLTIRGPLIVDVSGGDGGKEVREEAVVGEVLERFIATEETEQMEEMGQPGGNGAQSGNLVLSSPKIESMKSWVGTKILVKDEGGNPGEGGRAGYHGGAG
jgi:hypothetical protein